MLIRKTRIAKVLMWAMVPLVVFGSLPRMGCICADGQHKTFCQRHLQGNLADRCICCEGRDAKADFGSTKAAPTHSCCQAVTHKRPAGSPDLSQGRPCRPVVDRADVVTPVKA